MTSISVISSYCKSAKFRQRNSKDLDRRLEIRKMVAKILTDRQKQLRLDISIDLSSYLDNFDITDHQVQKNTNHN